MSGLVEGPPTRLDVRLQQRRPIVLPAGSLLGFERINRGKSPAPNYRWVLADDGGLRLARHSGDTSDPDRPFDTPLPDRPTAVLADDQVALVTQALRAADLDRQPDYLTDPGVEDGAFSVITVPTRSGQRELIFDGAGSTLITELRRVAEEWVTDPSDPSDPSAGDDEADF